MVFMRKKSSRIKFTVAREYLSALRVSNESYLTQVTLPHRNSNSVTVDSNIIFKLMYFSLFFGK